MPLDSWIVPDWPAPVRVKSAITTRLGGISTGNYSSLNLALHCGDQESAVRTNRARLRAHLPQEPKWLTQVHGIDVVAADGLTTTPCADASVARNLGTVCAVMIADCLPVLLCQREGEVIGISHAGWRGLSAGVIEATVEKMGVAPAHMVAYLGPAIGPAAFEVGDEVRAAFIAHDPAAESAFQAHGKNHWFADLYQLARQRLKRCGVGHVYGGGECTYSDRARFFSYRRDIDTGRMAALIWLAE